MSCNIPWYKKRFFRYILLFVRYYNKASQCVIGCNLFVFLNSRPFQQAIFRWNRPRNDFGRAFYLRGDSLKKFNLSCKILELKFSCLKCSLESSFLGRFCRNIACWKSLELRNTNRLQPITHCEALLVIPYKKENIAEKTPIISWNIGRHQQVLYMYGKREDQKSQWWQPKL